MPIIECAKICYSLCKLWSIFSNERNSFDLTWIFLFFSHSPARIHTHTHTYTLLPLFVSFFARIHFFISIISFSFFFTFFIWWSAFFSPIDANIPSLLFSSFVWHAISTRKYWRERERDRKKAIWRAGVRQPLFICMERVKREAMPIMYIGLGKSKVFAY